MSCLGHVRFGAESIQGFGFGFLGPGLQMEGLTLSSCIVSLSGFVVCDFAVSMLALPGFESGRFLKL